LLRHHQQAKRRQRIFADGRSGAGHREVKTAATPNGWSNAPKEAGKPAYLIDDESEIDWLGLPISREFW